MFVYLGDVSCLYRFITFECLNMPQYCSHVDSSLQYEASTGGSLDGFIVVAYILSFLPFIKVIALLIRIVFRSVSTLTISLPPFMYSAPPA